METVRDRVLHAVLGVLGIVFGLLSAVALALAAVIPPILGLLALLVWPVRVLMERLRRPRVTP